MQLSINYQNIADQSIFEIGRRLKHVKEKDLVHGQWIEWLEKVDVYPREAQRFIKIVSDPQLKTTTWSHLGSRALYEISGVLLDERDKKHVTSNGESKTPDEMTRKELRELDAKDLIDELQERAKENQGKRNDLTSSSTEHKVKKH